MLKLIQLLIFGSVFFEMFCRLKATDDKTFWQVRWSIIFVALTSFANVVSLTIWVHQQYELFLLFAFSVAVMQWAMARQWNKSAPLSFNGK